MKKILSIAAASLLIVSCFAGCDKKTSEESSEAVSQIEAETTEEETTEAETEEETTEAETEEETTEAETNEPLPELVIDEAEAKDFVGFWECTKMYTGGLLMEDEFYGMPMGVVMQMTINEDGTGFVGTGLVTDIEDSQDSKFTWEYKDNKITVTDEQGESEVCVLSEGLLVLAAEEESERIYFKKVDKLSTMTTEELYAAMGVDPDALTGEESTTEGSSQPASEKATETDTDEVETEEVEIDD